MPWALPYFLLLSGSVITLTFLSRLRLFSMHAAINSFAWLLLLVSIFAILVTGAHTVLLAVPCLLAVLAFAHLRSSVRQAIFSIKGLMKDIAIVWLMATLIFLIRLLWMTDLLSLGFPKLFHPDYAYYAQIAFFMKDYGIEATHFGHADIPRVINRPYHFFEIWMSAFYLLFEGVNAYRALMMVTFTLLTVYLWVVLGGIIRLISGISGWKGYTLAFLFLFTGGIFFSWYELIHPDLYWFRFNLWNANKLLVIYLFVATIVCLYIEKQKTAVWIFGALLMVCYTTTIFGILAVFGAMFLLEVFQERKLSLRHIAFGLTAVFLVSFYSYEMKTFNALINEFKVSYNLVLTSTSFNIILAGFVFIVLSFFLPIILSLSCAKTITKENVKSALGVIILVAAGMFGSLLGWSIFYLNTDASQLYTNLAIPLMSMVFVVLLTKVLHQSRNLKYLIILFLLFQAGHVLRDLYRPLSEQDRENQAMMGKLFTDNEKIGIIRNAGMYVSKMDYQPLSFYLAPLTTLYNGIRFYDITFDQVIMDKEDRYLLTKLYFYYISPQYSVDIGFSDVKKGEGYEDVIMDNSIRFLVPETSEEKISDLIELDKYRRHIFNGFNVYQVIN